MNITIGPAALRPGDRIVAVDGAPTDVTVTDKIKGNRVRLASPVREIERWLYADQHEALTVQRAAPRRRTLHGLTLVSKGSGEWETEDGRHGVSRQRGGYYVCDEPHVVRHTNEEAAATGRRGSYCSGGAEHENAPEWIAWSDDTAVDAKAHAWEPLFTDAVANLATALRQCGYLEQ